ncbi:hypothetical protein Goshw_011544, partial [Gossypium schwendimanii]|nr:hypothetical protein [Gossypium schwendimanii]
FSTHSHLFTHSPPPNKLLTALLQCLTGALFLRQTKILNKRPRHRYCTSIWNPFEGYLKSDYGLFC